MIQRFYRLLIELTNRKWTSILLKRFAGSSASKVLIPSFAKVYKINQAEMEKDLRSYESLHDFFIRKLKQEARTVAEGNSTIISPVDAILDEIGSINSDLKITVKGKPYSITEMLGSTEAAADYQGGTYILLYLSPSHYHRIHSPINGKVHKQWSLGSRSYPVNRFGLKYGKDTLAKNYRTITEIAYGKKKLALVKVGAMFVNSIETTHKGEELQKGEEIAYFTFGSTVVLLLEAGAFKCEEGITLPHAIKMGEKLGDLS